MVALSESEKKTLATVLDELIPPSADGRVPGAGALGVVDFLESGGNWVDDPVGLARTVLAFIARHTGDFACLDRATRVALLKQAEAETGEAFATLVHLTYMGYYSRPDIRPLFGVGAHPVHPEGYAVPREDDGLMRELTAPVRARGAFYRG